MSSNGRFALWMAKALLLFPLRLLVAGFKRERPGQGSGPGVWAASMGGARGTVYMGRMGILPAMLVMSLITLVVMLMFVVAGAALVALSPVLLASRLLSRPEKPALDDAIPTTGRVRPDEPRVRPLRSPADTAGDVER